MSLSPFDLLGVSQVQLDQLMKPYRDQHEMMLKALVPYRQQEELLRDLTKSLAGVGLFATNDYEKIVESFKGITGPQLQDFSSLRALVEPATRDLVSAMEAVAKQSRWIEDAFRLTRSESDLSAVLGSIEKLTASRNLLLQGSRWEPARPFTHALTDIFLVGRASWALSEGVAKTHQAEEREERLDDLVARSGAVIEELSKVKDSHDETIPVEEAEQQAQAVAELLTTEARELPHIQAAQPPAFVLDPVLAGGNELLTTIVDVMRLVETRNGRPLAGGYAAWLLKSLLVVTDPQRTAEDRFDSLIRFLYDFFIDAVNHAGQSLQKARPPFFQTVIQDLRHKEASHTPEAANKPSRIGANLIVREQRLREIWGKVPVNEEEWRAALLELLRRAAEAAMKFRDSL